MEGLLDKAWQSPLQTSVACDGFPRFQEAPGGRTGIPSILGGKAWEGWAEVWELYKIFGICHVHVPGCLGTARCL